MLLLLVQEEGMLYWGILCSKPECAATVLEKLPTSADYVNTAPAAAPGFFFLLLLLLPLQQLPQRAFFGSGCRERIEKDKYHGICVA